MVEVAGQIQIASPRQIEGHHHFIPPNREMQAIASQPPQQAHQHTHHRRLPPGQGRFGRAGAATQRSRLSGRGGLSYFFQQGQGPQSGNTFCPSGYLCTSGGPDNHSKFGLFRLGSKAGLPGEQICNPGMPHDPCFICHFQMRCIYPGSPELVF